MFLMVVFFSNLLTTAIQFFMRCNCIERDRNDLMAKKFICTLNEYKTHLICFARVYRMPHARKNKYVAYINVYIP